VRVEYVDDEAECVAAAAEFLTQEGEGRAIVYVAADWAWQRLRALIDIEVPWRHSVVVARSGLQSRAINMSVGDRLLHMTTLLPKSVDGTKCDLAVCYMGRHAQQAEAEFARVTGVGRSK
jgi:hypothetical protein